MVIYLITFAVACLYAYIVNWQGHNSWEKIHNWVKKMQKFSSSNILLYIVFKAKFESQNINSDK